MQKVITNTETFRQLEEFIGKSLRAGSGQPFELSELAVSPDGRTVAGTGAVMDKLEGLPIQRICLVDLHSGEMRQVTSGSQRDRLPRWDPKGERIAYLSDSTRPYDFQLHLLTLATGETRILPVPSRWVESLQWSADGTQILLLAAGQGADLPGAQGAISAPGGVASDAPAWTPNIDTGAIEEHWRSAWVCDLDTGECTRKSPPGVNVWEACWLGKESIACIASDSPHESAWYTADVRSIDLTDGRFRTIYKPRDQLGWLSASPSGRRIAFVEAVCSDRLLVAGTLLVGDMRGVTPVDSRGIDVTFTGWQGESNLLFAGLRGFESVLAHLDERNGATREVWASATCYFGGMTSSDVAPLPSAGGAVMMVEGHLVPPTLTHVTGDGQVRTPATFAGVSPSEIAKGASVKNFEWTAKDGLIIQGWLLLPNAQGPHPLVMMVHGGPVWRMPPLYIGRGGGVATLRALLNAGYAIFFPQPRGTPGRGQDFARAVFGDAGGADAQDLLSGIDHLVEQGFADPARLGVMGGSYGGYMTAWLVTQDSRFAAAVPTAPVTDWPSGRLTSHAGTSAEMLMGGKPDRPDSLYYSRSPVNFAERVKTPTLIICGELDRSTPPTQAQQFHRALQLAGAKSVLLTYPGEGHGIRRYPAVIDQASRVVDWFMTHMPPSHRT